MITIVRRKLRTPPLEHVRSRKEHRWEILCLREKPYPWHTLNADCVVFVDPVLTTKLKLDGKLVRRVAEGIALHPIVATSETVSQAHETGCSDLDQREYFREDNMQAVNCPMWVDDYLEERAV